MAVEDGRIRAEAAELALVEAEERFAAEEAGGGQQAALDAAAASALLASKAEGVDAARARAEQETALVVEELAAAMKTIAALRADLEAVRARSDAAVQDALRAQVAETPNRQS